MLKQDEELMRQGFEALVRVLERTSDAGERLVTKLTEPDFATFGKRVVRCLRDAEVSIVSEQSTNNTFKTSVESYARDLSIDWQDPKLLEQ